MVAAINYVACPPPGGIVHVCARTCSHMPIRSIFFCRCTAATSRSDPRRSDTWHIVGRVAPKQQSIRVKLAAGKCLRLNGDWYTEYSSKSRQYYLMSVVRALNPGTMGTFSHRCSVLTKRHQFLLRLICNAAPRLCAQQIQ